MGASGGIPALTGGLFPGSAMFNPQGMQGLDLGGWAQSGGTQFPQMGVNPFQGVAPSPQAQVMGMMANRMSGSERGKLNSQDQSQQKRYGSR